MVLLLGNSDLHEWKYKDSGAKEDLGVEVDSSDLLEHISVFALDFFEDFSNGGKTVLDVLLISVSSLKEEDPNDVG